MIQWFNAREATELGNALAESLAARASADPTELGKPLQDLLHDAAIGRRASRLNVFKRAKLANTFKWRLLEKGVAKNVANEITRELMLHLSARRPVETPGPAAGVMPAAIAEQASAKDLLYRGNQRLEQGDFAAAAAIYRELIAREPRGAEAHHCLGVAQFKLGHYGDAELLLRKAIELEPDYYAAYASLGGLLRAVGRAAESEAQLRRALKINPACADARASLGETLLLLGRARDAKSRFLKVLESSPHHIEALLGSAEIAQIEGRFEEATAIYGRALAIQPKLPRAWAALTGLSKMTAADRDWLRTAEELAAGGISALDESTLRFAIGKYCDDIKDYPRAFESYRQANRLLKAAAPAYEPAARTQYVDAMIRKYSREAIEHSNGGSSSMKPVFIVGMLRSGASLAEQIIASHPAVRGAGELLFWSDASNRYREPVERGVLDASTRAALAEEYLRALGERAPDVAHIIDKAPFNADLLGLIHCVFPKARIIYMRRDPIDTCLSCYFQQLPAAMNFTMDLSELAHYYREHERLMAHWCGVLPKGSMLEVPYEQLVADPNTWMHKTLEFLGLEWNERCLDFNKTQRLVASASYWQVRQRVYRNSVARWRHYEKFIGPLLELPH
jgi:tetratricopeptide (TPR) repeat protein